MGFKQRWQSWREKSRGKGKRVAAYAALFVLSLLVFLYWTFPYERLREALVQRVENPPDATGTPRPSGLKLEIVELSPAWVTGVELSGVQVRKHQGDAAAAPLVLNIDRLYARLNLWPLLLGRITVSFVAELAGGTISGRYQAPGDSSAIEADIDTLNLQQLGVIRSALGIPVTGTLQGKLNFVLPEELSDSNGSADLQIDALSLGDGKAKLKVGSLREGLTIDKVNAGRLHIGLHVDAGHIRIEECKAAGPDLSLQGEGGLQLLRPMKLSRLDLQLRLKFSNAYRNRNERTRTLFSLMEFEPSLQAAQTSNGFLQYKVQGALGGRITATPNGQRGR